MTKSWMIYGAYGYTGRLIAEEALKRGEKPILAGRDANKILAMARETGLEGRAFGLKDDASAHSALSDIDTLLLAAGPFSETMEPALALCQHAKCNYLDITGEISVFEAIFAKDAALREAGIVAIPGVGFDVVPTDCLAAELAKEVPDATSLVLAFHTRGSRLSPGTAKTMVEHSGDGGKIREDGKIVTVPPAYEVRSIPFHSGDRRAVTIPWGDVSTAFHSTKIPNIKVFLAMSNREIQFLTWSRHTTWLMRAKFLRNLIKARIERRVKGPSEAEREAGRVSLYGEAKGKSGEPFIKRLETPEGYAFTAMAAVEAVRRVRSTTLTGAKTPSMAFGANFVYEIPGVRRT